MAHTISTNDIYTGVNFGTPSKATMRKILMSAKKTMASLNKTSKYYPDWTNLIDKMVATLCETYPEDEVLYVETANGEMLIHPIAMSFFESVAFNLVNASHYNCDYNAYFSKIEKAIDKNIND